MPAFTDHPLRPICSAWINKIRLALDYKKKNFQEDADEAQSFFNGPYDFLYNLQNSRNSKGFIYTGEEGDLARPSFSMTVNKVAEMVQLFGPSLYHRNPVRQVNPRQYPLLPIELFGDPQDPMAQQAYLQMQGQVKQLRGVDKGRAVILQSLMNYTPTALDLKTESRNGVDEGIIKGEGLLWTRVHQPAGSPTKLVGSFFDTVDNLLVDPDMESLRDATWCAQRCVHPYWQVEQEYGLEPDSLRSTATLESYGRQAETVTDPDGDYNRRRGITSDLVVYWKIYSKMGLGSLLSGVTKDLREKLDGYGKFLYLVVADNVPYPLNIPPEIGKAMMEADPLADPALGQMVNQAVAPLIQWPTPFWADDTWPFSPLIFHPIPRMVWPMSHVKPGMGELKFINWAYSFLAGKVKTSCRDFLAIAKSAGEELKENIRVGQDYTFLEVEAIQGDIDKVVKFLQHPSFQQDIYKVIQGVEQNFEKRVGLTELMYGMSENQMRSAEEAQAKENKTSIRPDDMANKVEDWMTDVARKEALAARWHLEPKDIEPILGPVGAQAWEQLLMPSDPGEILHQLEYRIEAGSARKPNKARDAQNMNQAVTTLFQPMLQFALTVGDFMPLNALITDWAKSIDLDPEKYLFRPPPPPPGMGPPGLPTPPGGPPPGPSSPPPAPPGPPGPPATPHVGPPGPPMPPPGPPRPGGLPGQPMTAHPAPGPMPR